MIDKADQWPGCYIIIGCGDHIYIAPVYLPGISRIRCFGINGFHNIIGPIKRLIPDKLDLHCAIPQFLHNENSHILLLILVECCTQDNGVYSSIHVIGNRDIVNEIVPIKVQVIDHVFTVIEASLKSFQGFRLLEQIHDSIEVKIVARKTEIFIWITLGRYLQRSCCKDCQGVYDM